MMKAIHIESRSKAVILEKPIPKLRPGTILVRPKAVAIQPSDWKHVDYMWVGDPTGVRLGFEYAGDVVAVLDNSTHEFKKGDRVFGLCHAANVAMKEDGTFAEFAVVRSEFQMKLPDHMSYVEASAISSGLTPVGLYQDLQLPLPTSPSPSPKKPTPLLIYGGSTASGMMGIQFAKMSNCKVVVTCSPKNFGHLSSLGADHCIDRHSETCAAEIKEALAGVPLRHAWDCIATVQSARICAEAMAPKGGHYSSLLFLSGQILRRVNPNIKCSTTVGYTIFGEEFSKETVVEARPDDYQFWIRFWKLSERLLHESKLKPPPLLLNVGGHGLEGILHGLQYLKQGNVSAGKLVYTLSSNSGTTDPPVLAVEGELLGTKNRERLDKTRDGPLETPLFSAAVINAAFRETKRRTDDIVAEAGFSGYFAKVHAQHVELCVTLIIEGLGSLGCDLERAKRGGALQRIKAAAPGVQNQLNYCHQLLCDAGLIRFDADQIVRTDTPLPGRSSGQVLSEVVQAHPAVSNVSRLIHHTGAKLADLWSGRTDGVRVVFGTPLGKQLIGDVYGADSSSQAFHRLLEDFLGRILSRVHPGQCTELEGGGGRRIRLLELGAGTGGTTKWLAPLLERSQGAMDTCRVKVEYTFTDLAHGFVSQAARTFRQYSFMTYRVHDMETAPPSDLAGTQDVVVAVNAVHATADMVQSLANARRFLRPGGIALVLEIQELACWADFIFGFFDGWWRFTDGRTHAMAGAEEWHEAFKNAGFTSVDWTGGTNRDSRFQRLFLATA